MLNNINKSPNRLSFSLTDHQEQTVKQVLNEVKRRSYGLYGSAGVGKTYCLNYIVQTLRRQNKVVFVTAPTHKALQVLRGKVQHTPERFRTIHSFLGYKMYYQKEKVYFKPVNNYIPPHCDYLILDEASMVNEEMVEVLAQYQEDYGLKVIPVGDHKQLPPVGEERSLLLDYPGSHLTEIVRQKKGSRIIDLSRNLDLLFSPKTRRSTPDYKFTRKINYQDLAEARGTDECKFISWRNFHVDTVSKVVRDKIYGEVKKDYEPGETLYFVNPVNNFHNNQEVVVDHIVEEEYHVDEFSFPIYRITFDGHRDTVITPTSEGLPTYKEYTKSLVEACKDRSLSWRTYYDWIESWAMLKPNYSLTVHRSQGSTYEKTLINLSDIMCNPNDSEKQKMLYTAVTRASDYIEFII